MNEQGRTRQGKDNIFKKDWDEGHDPLKPYIEPKDEKDERKKPTSNSYDICDMKDEELGDFLGEEEKKALKEARKQRKENKGRDVCKEYHEKKKKDERDNVDTLSQRNQVLENHARKLESDFAEYKEQTDRRMTHLAELVKGMLEDAPPLGKLKRIKTIVKE